MADLKISALTSAGALAGTEPLPIVQGGSTKKTTAQDIANLKATPNLQQVTNVGFSTTNRLVSDDAAGNITEIGNGYIVIATGNIGDVNIDASLVTASYVAQLPDKPTSPQTFAMLSDITGSGDVYLANDQTFTGENTFAIASGSKKPIIVTKGGNGAGIKVTKSSGSGDAIEVAQGSVSIADETVSTIAHFDGSKSIKSLATSTYPSLTELSYVKDVTSAIQTQLNGKVTSFASGADGTASSGTTNTISISVLIPANTFALDDVIRINHRVRATGTAATRETRVYANTTNVIAGAVLVATATLTSTILSANLQRFLAIKNATTNTEVITATSSQLTDYNNLTTAVSTLAINWTVDQYIIFAVNAINAADSIRATMYSIEKL
jgi:hypothetical protein